MIFSLTHKSLLLICVLVSSNLLAETAPVDITVMSLNIYGWKTMPQHSDTYAQLIKSNKVDVVGIQEGVDDWQLKTMLPTNYNRSIALKKSLGKCWQHKFQIFINQCNGNKFVKTGRFDLTDGPNATRTGEYAVIDNSNFKYLLVNVHWDHESKTTRIANAEETASQLNKIEQYSKVLYPKILLGDFNSQCNGNEVSIVKDKTNMILLGNAGIDCIFIKGLTGSAKTIEAFPSDHPAIVAKLRINSISIE